MQHVHKSFSYSLHHFSGQRQYSRKAVLRLIVLGVAGRKKELSADYHFLPEIFDVRYKNLLKIYENIISTRNNVWSKSGIRLKLLCSIRPGYCHKTTFLRYLTFFVFLFFCFFFSPIYAVIQLIWSQRSSEIPFTIEFRRGILTK